MSERKITNEAGLSLPITVWLLKDDYDYDDREFAISTTTLLKPIRALVLSKQKERHELKEIDLKDLIASRLGSAVHNALEDAWKNPETIKKAMELNNMGHLASRVAINPADADLTADTIPIYMENRSEKRIGRWIVTGKYDLILDGRLSDYKSTSVYAFIFDSNKMQYIKQGSIYRWLNPDKIKDDVMNIEYLFTDWSSIKARTSADYPKLRSQSKSYPLMSLDETEKMIKEILAKLDFYLDKPQAELPLCTSEELWQKETVWKYYKNPNNTTRSTKNCQSPEEAQQRFEADGSVGKIVEVPGEVKRCLYCDVMEHCTQAERFILDGLLKP